MEQNAKKNLLMFGALVLVIFVLVVAAISRQLSLSGKLTITAVPSVSHITINGHSAKQGVNRVQPGAETIVVSYAGFTTITQKVSVVKGQNKPINIVLSSNSNSTANWYFTHPADETTAEGISSNTNDALSKQSQKNAPLIRLLPFVGGGLSFRVDYGNLPGANANRPVIYITAPTQQGQQAGLSWIRSVGFDPAKYDIEYVTGVVQPLNS